MISTRDAKACGTVMSMWLRMHDRDIAEIEEYIGDVPAEILADILDRGLGELQTAIDQARSYDAKGGEVIREVQA